MHPYLIVAGTARFAEEVRAIDGVPGDTPHVVNHRSLTEDDTRGRRVIIRGFLDAHLVRLLMVADELLAPRDGEPWPIVDLSAPSVTALASWRVEPRDDSSEPAIAIVTDTGSDRRLTIWVAALADTVISVRFEVPAGRSLARLSRAEMSMNVADVVRYRVRRLES